MIKHQHDMVHVFNPAAGPGRTEGLVSKTANCQAGKGYGHWVPMDFLLPLPTRGAQNMYICIYMYICVIYTHIHQPHVLSSLVTELSPLRWRSTVQLLHIFKN